MTKLLIAIFIFFFQAEDVIRDATVTGVQTCALPICGKILAEKRDQVIVDLGFTVLTIPRNQIVKISKEDLPETKGKPSLKPLAATPVESAIDLYQSGRGGSTETSVRELVNQLGEAVVQ